MDANFELIIKRWGFLEDLQRRDPNLQRTLASMFETFGPLWNNITQEDPFIDALLIDYSHYLTLRERNEALLDSILHLVVTIVRDVDKAYGEKAYRLLAQIIEQKDSQYQLTAWSLIGEQLEYSDLESPDPRIRVRRKFDAYENSAEGMFKPLIAPIAACLLWLEEGPIDFCQVCNRTLGNLIHTVQDATNYDTTCLTSTITGIPVNHLRNAGAHFLARPRGNAIDVEVGRGKKRKIVTIQESHLDEELQLLVFRCGALHLAEELILVDYERPLRDRGLVSTPTMNPENALYSFITAMAISGFFLAEPPSLDKRVLLAKSRDNQSRAPTDAIAQSSMFLPHLLLLGEVTYEQERIDSVKILALQGDGKEIGHSEVSSAKIRELESGSITLQQYVESVHFEVLV